MPLLFGAFGFVIVLFLDLRRRRLTALTSLRLPVLALLDLLASPLTAGLALALLATVCPEAYRSGVLKLTSSAVVALALCVVVLPLFWTEGRKQIQFQRPVGLLFAEWLIFAGGGNSTCRAISPARVIKFSDGNAAGVACSASRCCDYPCDRAAVHEEV